MTIKVNIRIHQNDENERSTPQTRPTMRRLRLATVKNLRSSRSYLQTSFPIQTHIKTLVHLPFTIAITIT